MTEQTGSALRIVKVEVWCTTCQVIGPYATMTRLGPAFHTEANKQAWHTFTLEHLDMDHNLGLSPVV